MSGKLKNLTRRAHTFHLTTKIAPKRAVFERATLTPDGSYSVQTARVVFPDTVTVKAGVGEMSIELPDAAKLAPEIAKAIELGLVKWESVAAVAEPAPDGAPTTIEKRKSHKG